MSEQDPDRLRDAVRADYGKVAEAAGGCCGGEVDMACGPAGDPAALAATLGYTPEELAAVPEGANLGLGCGNPQAIAALKPGETVLDLGAGAGFDAFLAARAVGPAGRVIGVDMTAGMLAKARDNAARAGLDNVEFRLGEIEHLPVADGSVDAILSNCVINLSPDKAQVCREAFRVLKPGGRLAVSDIVATAELPEAARRDLALYTGCMAGASTIDGLEAMLAAAGFEAVRIEPKDESRAFIRDWAPGRKVEEYVAAATIEAVRPAAGTTAADDAAGTGEAAQPPLHPAIVSMVSLAAGIAAGHPDMGLCQLDRLRGSGVPEHQIAAVVEIARHLREEAGQRLDAAFDEAAAPPAPVKPKVDKGRPAGIQVADAGEACCTPTPGGQSCC